jgi:regulator of nonsense transcripts 1
MFPECSLQIVDRADVLCVTAVSSGTDLITRNRITRVLMDEATQCTEPAALIPITKGCRSLVMVGSL